MPLNTQLGAKTETTWNTPVTVDRFFEFNSESIQPETERWESAGLRAGNRGQRADRYAPYVKGHAGSVEMDVLTKGWGLWLPHLLGAVATGALTDSTYTHTASVATLCGDSFTLQVNKPIGPCGDTNQAFTYAGGKIGSWELSCQTGEALKFKADMLFGSGSTATALATASYPTTMEPFPFTGVGVTVGGAALNCSGFTVKCSNALDGDRMRLGSASRREPVENGFRDITVDFTGVDFDTLADFYNRVTQTAPGTQAVVITCLGPTLAGASTYPAVILTMDAVRWDAAPIAVSGPARIDQQPSGKALVPASGNQLTVAYRTTDATP